MSGGKVRTEGSNADDVWAQLHNDAGKANPNYFGYKGARARFLEHFQGGFHADDYCSRERNYKIEAKEKLDAEVPLNLALTGTGYGEAVLSAYRSTNLLSPFEKTKLQDALRGNDADTIVQSLANFAIAGSQNALAQLDAALMPYDSAKWTVATYLPYLWQPDQHMFLKPEVTKDFAERVGHPFSSVYDAKLVWTVYEELLEMVGKVETELSDLKPRDRIDIQSFIWVVGKYQVTGD